LKNTKINKSSLILFIDELISQTPEYLVDRTRKYAPDEYCYDFLIDFKNYLESLPEKVSTDVLHSWCKDIIS